MRDKHSPQKILVSIALAVALLIGSAITVLAWRMHDENRRQPAVSQTEPTAKEPASNTSVSYKGKEGKTALELLKQNAKVITKDSSYGPYVDSINGVPGGKDGKYWTFYVNGEQAQVGADAYTTKNSDTVEWKFE